MSGKDGRVLHSIATKDSGGGWQVGAAGDMDRDGHGDFFISTMNAGRFESVSAYSGKTGKVLHTWGDGKTTGLLGWSVGAAGDVNRDGHDDRRRRHG